MLIYQEGLIAKVFNFFLYFSTHLVKEDVWHVHESVLFFRLIFHHDLDTDFTPEASARSLTATSIFWVITSVKT